MCHHPFGRQPAFDQGLTHRLGALQGKRLIDLGSTEAVGMAFDADAEFRAVLEPRCDAIERR
nr:hypothetical protein [Halochromatium salexigens]